MEQSKTSVSSGIKIILSVQANKHGTKWKENEKQSNFILKYMQIVHQAT